MIILALIFAIQTDWQEALQNRGWNPVGASTGSVIFIRPGPRPNLHWERIEFRDPLAGGMMSAMSLHEVDCPGGRSRTLQTTTYSGRNLEGRTLGTVTETRGWVYAPPGTISESFFRRACE